MLGFFSSHQESVDLKQLEDVFDVSINLFRLILLPASNLLSLLLCPSHLNPNPHIRKTRIFSHKTKFILPLLSFKLQCQFCWGFYGDATLAILSMFGLVHIYIQTLLPNFCIFHNWKVQENFTKFLESNFLGFEKNRYD